MVQKAGAFDEESDGGAVAGGGRHLAHGALLVDDAGVFCFGPKVNIHAILGVQRYVDRWPLIPAEELHASSVQHPDDPAMRWLLHSRRVDCTPPFPGPNELPRCAGVGVKEKACWCCRTCVDKLCQESPVMPPLALANANFLGRHHVLFRSATLAMRMLASSAKLFFSSSGAAGGASSC